MTDDYPASSGAKKCHGARVTGCGTAHHQLTNIFDAKLKEVEAMKFDAQENLTTRLSNDKGNMDNVLKEFNSECQALRDNTDKDIRKEVVALLKEKGQCLWQIEKDCVREMDETWDTTRTNILKVLFDTPQDALADRAEEFETRVDEIIILMNKQLFDNQRTIREKNDMIREHLDASAEKYLKKEFNKILKKCLCCKK